MLQVTYQFARSAYSGGSLPATQSSLTTRLESDAGTPPHAHTPTGPRDTGRDTSTTTRDTHSAIKSHSTAKDIPIAAKYRDTLITAKGTPGPPGGTPSPAKDAFGTRSNGTAVETPSTTRGAASTARNTTTITKDITTITRSISTAKDTSNTAENTHTTTTDAHMDELAEKHTNKTQNTRRDSKDEEGENINTLPEDAAPVSLPPAPSPTAREMEAPNSNELQEGSGSVSVKVDTTLDDLDKTLGSATEPLYNPTVAEELAEDTTEENVKEDSDEDEIMIKRREDQGAALQRQNDGQYKPPCRRPCSSTASQRTSETKFSAKTFDEEDEDEGVKMLRKILQEAQEAIQRFRMDFQPSANLSRSNVTVSIPWEKFVAEKTAQRVLGCRTAGKNSNTTTEGKECSSSEQDAVTPSEDATNPGKMESETTDKENPIRHNEKHRKTSRHRERKGNKGNRKRGRGGSKGNNKQRTNTRKGSKHTYMTPQSTPITPLPLTFQPPTGPPLSPATSFLTPSLSPSLTTPSFTLWDTWQAIFQQNAKKNRKTFNEEEMNEENESKTLPEETVSEENVRTVLAEEEESEENAK